MSCALPSLFNHQSSGVSTFNPRYIGDKLDEIMLKYEVTKQELKDAYQYVNAHRSVISAHLISGNNSLFLNSLDTAIKSLDAAFWLNLIDDTKLRNYMDTGSYNNWKENLKVLKKTPEFNRENVETQLQAYIGDIENIFTHRINTIFTKLSPEHVTNSPAGFRNRMIFSQCGSSVEDFKTSGYVHDLRCVIALLRGEVEMPTVRSTEVILYRVFDNTGKWLLADGGSLRIKAFKKGTVHIEIDWIIADQMNAVLANLHPNCLPQARKIKPLFKSTLAPVDTLISHEVRARFSQVRISHPFIDNPEYVTGKRAFTPKRIRDKSTYVATLSFNKFDTNHLDEAKFILSTVFGSEPTLDSFTNELEWKLGDFNPYDALDHLICVGTYPEVVSHQLYESTDYICSLVSDVINVDANEDVCEPSVGRGKLAKLLPKDQTKCFDINALNCAVVAGLGYSVERKDFLDYANETSDRFDWIIMNPPYLNQLYWTHLKAAMSLLKSGGKVVAVVPQSVKGKESELPSDITMTINYEVKEQFEGTGVLNIAVITLEKSNVIRGEF
ncbi:DUF4942 domain-containing protein [Vibrio vulnificus]|uniref:DUF4942 domain-containing protein n=1 Tax=Vibrio vulnificus TaxID=672 RepID=UPI0005F0D045|nr:DUF4942 domain-containing protein [Vibrio vulnificus]MDG2759105.1 DUF4942 domain-containing protein [Vibrio parahaemolyticus]HDY7668924.1 DUF4942 domain-containing protein [Vibrio vulnificus]